jgi:hypothetical protein
MSAAGSGVTDDHAELVRCGAGACHSERSERVGRRNGVEENPQVKPLLDAFSAGLVQGTSRNEWETPTTSDDIDIVVIDACWPVPSRRVED